MTTMLKQAQARPQAKPTKAQVSRQAPSRGDRSRIASEHEVDRVAAQPLRTPTVLQRTCSCEEKERVERRAQSPDAPRRIPPSVEHVNRSGGVTLDSGLQAHFESAYGSDLGNVVIHADASAAEAARAVNARAYTSGDHVVFGAGEFAPRSQDGFHLLAHELAHVVQQRTGSVPPGISRPGDASELEADRLAGAVALPLSFERRGTGDDVRSSGLTSRATGDVVQRWPGDGMVPPGDCSWATYLPLRAAVEAAKAVVNALGACTVADVDCATLALKIAAITTEIAARVALDTTCFRGGDAGHREAVQGRVNMLGRCWKRFLELGCPQQIAAAAAAVAAAEAAAQAAAADAAAAVEAAATTTAELVEGAAVAGETAAEGVTLLEVLEGIGLVLAL